MSRTAVSPSAVRHATAAPSASPHSELNTPLPSLPPVGNMRAPTQAKWRRMSRTAKKQSGSKRQKPGQVLMSHDLGQKVYQVAGEWASGLYSDIVPDDALMDFLNSASSGYDTASSRWAAIPENPTCKAELSSPLLKLLSDILNHFYPSFPPGVFRNFVDSHNIPLAHYNSTRTSQADISIQARGSSFAASETGGPDDLGYTNIAGVIDVRVEKEWGSRREQADRLATNCRQILAQQPNRHYSRSLTVTETHFRLVHYDRSGTYLSPVFNIHKHRTIFLRFVLGLASPDEDLLGFDTSVQWNINGATGRKTSGTIIVNEYDEATKVSTPVTYDLDMDEPPFVRSNIRGRGTVAWHAMDPVTKEPVLIKDAWRTSSRVSECDLLKAARNIPGVVDMITFQDFCAQTSDYRPPGFQAKDFYNRIKLRVVMKKYGPSVWYFKSRLQLLQALRDALTGHRKLLDRGILHRDISMQNLLLGKEDGLKGYRGALIDLDMAVKTDGLKSPIPPNPGMGTRLYQSVSVLQSLEITPCPPQDYLDDLESFFYVLCHVIFAFLCPGVLTPEQPHFLETWSSKDERDAATSKSGFIVRVLPASKIAPFWKGACLTLLKEFQKVVSTIVLAKDEIAEDVDLDVDEKVNAYEVLANNPDVYYDKVEAAFDKAITQLEKEGPCPAEREPYPESFLSPPIVTSSLGPDASSSPESWLPVIYVLESSEEDAPLPKKRPSEDDEDGMPRKRRRAESAAEPLSTLADEGGGEMSTGSTVSTHPE